jgi:DNA-binding NarL/FixJ family response regulator
MITVILCDDNALIRRGIRDTLSDAPDIEVVGEAGDYGELRTLMRKDSATCWCWTSTCPAAAGWTCCTSEGRGLDGEGAGRQHVPEDQYAIRALRAGAFGYVNKGGDPQLLVQAVRTVSQGAST